MIVLACQCGKTYRLDASHAGRTVQCRNCGTLLSVPKEGDRKDEPATTQRMPAAGKDGRDYESLARFTMLRECAKGGMGRVSVAQDVTLNRTVAVKELLVERAGSSSHQQRFVAEAEITGQLEHPGIVPIYAIGTDAHGKPFYAMRLVKGDTLKQVIEAYHQSRRPQALRELLRRFIMVCHAVAYAHKQGVIHRDLKPANVMLGPFGETLVMDWGLSKRVRDGQSDRSTMGDAAKRQPAANADRSVTGDIVGTPAYMSPEQALGKVNELNATTDVFSLGAVLYQILTGKPPYAGTAAEVVDKARKASPEAPGIARKDVPGALEAICLKAMDREPKKRYGSAAELAESVQRWLDDETVPGYREPPLERIFRWSRKHKSATVSSLICLVLILIIASTATVLYQRERDKARAAQRLADDYLRQAEEARRQADLKESEANRLATDVEASRRSAVEAMKEEARASLAATQAQEKIAQLEAELTAKAAAGDELHKGIAAARTDLKTAQKQMEVESKRADAAAERATELERQVVALRREADEYRTLANGLTQLVGPLLNKPSAPAMEVTTPWSDFAKQDAAAFDVVASDKSTGDAANDSTRTRAGAQSLRVSAKTGSVSVTYPKSRNANWDLSKYEFLTLAFLIEDPAGGDIRRADLVVRIGRDSQCIEYRAGPDALAAAIKGWVFVKIPLAGDAVWNKKEIIPLDLSHVDWLQISFSTPNPAVSVWLDEVSFGADPRKVVRELAPGPELAATEYVVAIGGSLSGWLSGKQLTIRAMSDIPKDPFTVTAVFLNGNATVSDDGLKLLSKLENCSSLQLVGTRITDESIKHLKEMKSLYHLEIGRTRVSDKGIADLAEMPSLGAVFLEETRVTANGLQWLKNLPGKLQTLGLSPSNAPAGIGFLSEAPLHSVDVLCPQSQRKMPDAFVESLPKLPALTGLRIQGAFLSETQAKTIGEMKGLTSLSLFSCAGLSNRVLENLSQLSNLENLFIEGTGTVINDADFVHLTRLSRLKTLRLESESVEPAGVLRFQAALPDCKVVVSPNVQKLVDDLRKNR